MNPDSARTLYRYRRVVVVLACAAPVFVLGAVWLLVTRVLMVPAVPGSDTLPDQVVQFIMHEQGLPRLSRERCDAVLKQQIHRLIEDAKFRDRFAREYRVSSPEQQRAFREHVFDAFKPVVMADINGYHLLDDAERREYLDGRIVEYNRMATILANIQVNASAAGLGGGEKAEMLGLLLTKTTEHDRELGFAYIQAIQVRVVEILADPELEEQIRARIAAEP